LTEDENFEAFKIKFSDRHHATVKIFGEKLSAVLVSLPTTIETHRTVDGSHLFKSADVGEILIVHRPSSVPTGISKDFVFEHGLTPPTRDIVSKRQARQEAAKMQAGTSNPLEGIEYWEMVEIQLAALLSKDKTAKPICRQEFLEEPDIDPVILEKVLRKNGHPQFRGYSGQYIDESEIQCFDHENEPMVRIPREVVEYIAPDDDEEEEDIAIPVTQHHHQQQRRREEEDNDDERPPQDEEPRPEEEEDESEDEDEVTRTIADLVNKRDALKGALQMAQRTQERSNAYMKGKVQAGLQTVQAKIEDIQRQIDELKRSQPE
jgi:transcription initiation factor TFIID subunit 7